MFYLFLISIALIGFLFYTNWQHKKEIDLIIRAKLSKDLEEFISSEKPIEPTFLETPNPEIPLENMGEDEFKRLNNK